MEQELVCLRFRKSGFRAGPDRCVWETEEEEVEVEVLLCCRLNPA